MGDHSRPDCKFEPLSKIQKTSSENCKNHMGDHSKFKNPGGWGTGPIDFYSNWPCPPPPPPKHKMTLNLIILNQFFIIREKEKKGGGGDRGNWSKERMVVETKKEGYKERERERETGRETE